MNESNDSKSVDALAAGTSQGGLEATETHLRQPPVARSASSPAKANSSSFGTAELADPPPESVGRYRIVGYLGSGGFGVVYKGFDPGLQRETAIKVAHRQLSESTEIRELQLGEAQVVARLDHPGIVKVYDLGQTAAGEYYFVAQFISGGNLADRIKQSRCSPLTAATIVAGVAEALHHAHQRGLVHRDVKPANILLTDDGRPLVADFGLALKDEDFGKDPSFAGTVSYMSPEQARGDSHVVDPRSDVYSLGIVLCELLTGRLPYRSSSRDDLLREIAGIDVRPPRQLDESVPAELDRICARATAKHPAGRYSTALDMAQDLQRWLESETLGDVGRLPPTPTPEAPPRGSLTAKVAVPGCLITATVAVGCLMLLAVPTFFRPSLATRRAQEAEAYQRALVQLKGGDFVETRSTIAAATAAGLKSDRLLNLDAEAVRGIGQPIALAYAGRLSDFGYGSGVVARDPQVGVTGQDLAQAQKILDGAGDADETILLNRGHLLLSRGEPAKALAEFERARETSPSDVWAWLGCGLANFMLEAYSSAQHDFSKAIELDPQCVAARLNLALTLEELVKRQRPLPFYRALFDQGIPAEDRRATGRALEELNRQLSPTDGAP